MLKKFIAGFFAVLSLLGIAGCAPDAPNKVLVLTESRSYHGMLSRHSNHALVSTDNGSIELWQLSPKSLKHRWQHGTNTNESIELALSDNGEYAASLGRNSVALWRSVDGEQIGWWSLPESGQSIAVANQGSLLVALRDGSIMSLTAGQQKLLRFLGHHDTANSVALSADGKLALSGGSDNRAILWQATTGQPIGELLFDSQVVKVALSADGAKAFAADINVDARLFSTNPVKEISRLNIPQRNLTFSSARFVQGNQLLLTGTPSRTIMEWQVGDGKLINRWQVGLADSPQSKGAVVYSVATSDDPDVAAVSISSSGKVEYWPKR